MRHVVRLLVICGVLGCDRPNETAGTPPPLLVEVEVRAPWQGLRTPVAIRAARDGRVFVADDGAHSIRAFNSHGSALEAANVQLPAGGAPVLDFIATSKGMLVLDSARHFLRLSNRGKIAVVPARGREDVLGMLGNDQVILASNAQWSGPVIGGRREWPLARIMSFEGDSIAEIRGRAIAKSPFASHIRNFVLPAGTADGRYVWLAFLNRSEIARYDVASGETRIFHRRIMFPWRRIPESFRPVGPTTAAKIPFDGISYGIACDSTGRAYVLTAESAIPRNGALPAHMVVDVFDASDTMPVRRRRFAGSASHIAVSPDGSLIYLLNAHRGELRIMQEPGR